MPTIAELLITALADHGVEHIWGVVGDALNPVTDAIRREDRIEWMGVRHEEAGAFAASAQAQLTGRLGVCMGTVGPGAIHLLNGLYDAKKSRAPVLALCGQVPRPEMGSDFFQEVDNQRLFADVAVFNETILSPEQLPMLIEQAGNSALQRRGVAVLTLPGDVGGLDLPRATPIPRFLGPSSAGVPDESAVAAVAEALNDAGKITLLVGMGARAARADVLALANRLKAPMVLSLKAKDGFDDDNPFEIGQSGLIGNPATHRAFADCDALVLLGTDFPYKAFLPEGKTVIQVDTDAAHIGRRIPVDHAVVGDVGQTLSRLLPHLSARTDTKHLDKARDKYASWAESQRSFTDPGYDHTPTGILRGKVDNPERAIRPELLAAAVDRLAPQDAIFTTDTGMSTVWLSRFVRMTGTRRLIGSYNLGSMANAMPMALGASALDRSRKVIAFCGDGGLMMLMGDLRTAVTYDLPVVLVVFNNSRLGMVKLEMEQVGLAEYGTDLDNPDIAAVATAMGLHGIRVTDPHAVEGALAEAMAHPGPVLVDVVTNADEIAIPPKPTLDQAWGFAIAKTKEFLESRP
jgi:pyruvate dehydrogenase (quinone)